MPLGLSNFFEEQLQRVREIRLSERKFYQMVTDIYATSVGQGDRGDRQGARRERVREYVLGRTV